MPWETTEQGGAGAHTYMTVDFLKKDGQPLLQLDSPTGIHKLKAANIQSNDSMLS